MLEATTSAWYIHDLLEPMVSRVVVTQIKLIASAMVKTDKKDTMVLAKLLAVEMTPQVWMPPHHVRDLRALIAHRRRLVSQQTSVRTDYKVSCIAITLYHQQSRSTTLNITIGGSTSP